MYTLLIGSHSHSHRGGPVPPLCKFLRSPWLLIAFEGCDRMCTKSSEGSFKTRNKRWNSCSLAAYHIPGFQHCVTPSQLQVDRSYHISGHPGHRTTPFASGHIQNAVCSRLGVSTAPRVISTTNSVLPGSKIRSLPERVMDPTECPTLIGMVLCHLGLQTTAQPHFQQSQTQEAEGYG